MSANLDLVRSIYADWERGDFSRADWADPEIEYVRAEGPEPGTWSGLTGLAEGTRVYRDAFDELRLVADEYRELDDERVLVLVHRVARGKASGLELVQASGAELFHICGGSVIKAIWYWDRDRALADLGLAPEGGNP